MRAALAAALARGEVVNHIDKDCSALMMAAVGNNEAVVELLLQQPGLDVNLTSKEIGQTALHMASSNGYTGIVRRLLAYPSLTCHNSRDIHGFSPLMLALMMNQVECVRELVAAEGIDLETKDPQGRGL